MMFLFSIIIYYYYIISIFSYRLHIYMLGFTVYMHYYVTQMLCLMQPPKCKMYFHSMNWTIKLSPLLFVVHQNMFIITVEFAVAILSKFRHNSDRIVKNNCDHFITGAVSVRYD